MDVIFDICLSLKNAKELTELKDMIRLSTD